MISATYVPEPWSQDYNTEGTPLGETCDLGEVGGTFEEWIEGLLPGRYDLTNEVGERVAKIVVPIPGA